MSLLFGTRQRDGVLARMEAVHMSRDVSVFMVEEDGSCTEGGIDCMTSQSCGSTGVFADCMKSKREAVC
jgi:hypothetical protein